MIANNKAVKTPRNDCTSQRIQLASPQAKMRTRRSGPLSNHGSLRHYFTECLPLGVWLMTVSQYCRRGIACLVDHADPKWHTVGMAFERHRPMTRAFSQPLWPEAIHKPFSRNRVLITRNIGLRSSLSKTWIWRRRSPIRGYAARPCQDQEFIITIRRHWSKREAIGTEYLLYEHSDGA